MLRLVESKLAQEKESAVGQQRSQTHLLTNLQAIQVPEGSGLPSPRAHCLLLLCIVSGAALTRWRVVQATLERAESDSRQRLNNQLEKQEREISQLQKRLEQEVEQRHLHGRNQEVFKHSN